MFRMKKTTAMILTGFLTAGSLAGGTNMAMAAGTTGQKQAETAETGTPASASNDNELARWLKDKLEQAAPLLTPAPTMAGTTSEAEATVTPAPMTPGTTVTPTPAADEKVTPTAAPTATPTPTLTPTPTPVPWEEIPLLEEPVRYEAGSYEAGKDIPAGEYMIFALQDEAYAYVSSDDDLSSGDDISSGEDTQELLSDESFSYNTILTLAEGQYLYMNGCEAVNINDVRNSELDVTGSGMFKIGMHIGAGAYTLAADEPGAHYVVYPTSEQLTPASEATFDNTASVRVVNGQYLKLDHCHFQTPPAVIEIVYKDKETVTMVQEQLNKLGYDCGAADGMIGNRTIAAIQSYEQAAGLAVRPSITDELLASLRDDMLLHEIEVARNKATMCSIGFFEKRFNEAVEYFNQTGEEQLNLLGEDFDSEEEFSPNEETVFLRTLYQDTDRIQDLFMVTDTQTFSHQVILEFACALYGLDSSLETPEQALDLALRLSFYGTSDTERLSCRIIELGDGYAVWAKRRSDSDGTAGEEAVTEEAAETADPSQAEAAPGEELQSH